MDNLVVLYLVMFSIVAIGLVLMEDNDDTRR